MLRNPSRILRQSSLPVIAVAVLLTFPGLGKLAASPLRIVTYNIEADTGGVTTTRPGFDTVLQGIGNENVNGLARAVDILSLQETTSNSETVAPIVTMLNSMYGAGMYAMSPFQATMSSLTGNGPNAIVYNQASVQLIASAAIANTSTSGPPRQPMRYQFRPVGGISSNDFYVYVSHYKAGTQQSDLDRRDVEAGIIRSNAATLPASVRILYTGDFNVSSSSEASYQTLTAATPTPGQGFDPLNMPGDWALNSAFRAILTESAPDLRYRDDFHLVTQNVMNDSTGLRYVAGSYHTFGVNGTTPIHGTVDSSTNTALPGLPNRSAVLTALTTASDHLPVVADYNITIGQAPTITTQPTEQTACSGSSAMFMVVASGTPAPTYQWRKGATNLTNGGNISGATSATLSINPVGTADAATNYNCVATNSAGSATSNNVALSVRMAPLISAPPQNQSVCAGRPASFSVMASGSPPPSYQWRRGMTTLSDGGNISGTTTTLLTINPASTGDAAPDYNCIVSNACGSATSANASLDVFSTGGGDGNGDGAADGNDIRQMVTVLVAGGQPDAGYCALDMNGDGVVTAADLPLFVSLLLNT